MVSLAMERAGAAAQREGIAFTVTDLKQYRYCPRIAYFTYVQPVPRVLTAAMARGAEEHLRLEQLEPRRTVRRYGLETAERLFRVRLHSPTLGLSGLLDLLLAAESGYYPVEFKHSRQPPGANLRLQLSAYALLVGEEYDTEVDTGFFCLSPENRLSPVAIGETEKREVFTALEAMWSIVFGQQWPDATPDQHKCESCEWRNFCNDIR